MSVLRTGGDGSDGRAVTKLLINEPPLQVLPTLAVRLGLNEAIAVQQLHFAVTHFESRVVELDGHKWLRADYEFWGAQFPWWSKATIERTWKALRDKRVVHTTRGREANVYRIDYDALRQIEGSHPSDRPVQVPHIEGPPSMKEGQERNNGENDVGADEPPALFEQPSASPSPSPAPADVADDDVATVWTHYVEVFGTDHMRIKGLTKARGASIRKAINATNVEAACAAIDGLKSYRQKNPGGSRDITLGAIFETRPGGRNLTDQIEFWASQADVRLNDSSRKVPLDLSGVSAVVAGAIKARRLDVTRYFHSDNPDTRKRIQDAIAWLRENAGWEPIIENDELRGWRYVDAD